MPIHHPEVIHDPEAQWLRLRERIAPENRASVEAAFHLAARVHHGQYRKVKSEDAPVPYILHPLRVARIVLEEWGRGEPEVLAACLLHDVVEDCPELLRDIIEKEIERIEGREICDAVCLLTKPRLPTLVPPDVKATRDARYFKMLFAAKEWVRLVKCADRVDNLRDARVWGDMDFWERYSSETIGWHLYLARETAPIAEVALFKALVDGERELRGCVPIWADGCLIDPVAAQRIPEPVARQHGIIGLALRGETFVVGCRRARADSAKEIVRDALYNADNAPKHIETQEISEEAIADALNAGLYGK